MKLAIAGALLLWLHPAPARAQGDLLYDEVAARWSRANGVEDAKRLDEVLARAFARLELGVFDVYLPPDALADGRALADARAALLALAETQRALAAWVAGGAVARAGGKKKRDALDSWLADLTPKVLAAAARGGGDLASAAEGDAREALARFRGELRAGEALGASRELAGVPLVLFPRRADFVELLCVAGRLDPALRPSAWSEGVTTWLEYQADSVFLVTLEYTAGGGAGDYARGVSVGDRNPAALSQLVAQVGARALFSRVFAGGLDPALRSGIANALVIDLYGELDTRVDGDVRARTSEGRSVFVPGGNPDGGVLPPTSAENRWRGTKGKDHFVAILSQVQAQSGKKAKSRAEKLARFELVSDDGAVKELVSAPFLGPSAVKPRPEVLADYLELLRCYGVAFLHWLRIEGAGKPAESAARFGELLRALANGATTDDLPRVLQELYGQPLSADGAHGLFDGETLEGRFLAWLARRR